MQIKKLELEGFRSFQELSLDFTELTTLIHGGNGQGKTNILESIYFLSLTNSFRSDNKDLINFNSKYFSIRSIIGESYKRKVLSVFFDHNSRKILKINQDKCSAKDFIGNLKIVLFTPESIELTTQEPSKRRKFLDEFISKIDKNYFVSLQNYKRIVHQRNHILFKIKEGVSNLSELEIWNTQLIKEGSIIIKKRIKFIEEINKMMSPKYKEISGGDEVLLINYISTVDTEEDINSSFFKKLFSSYERDIRESATVVGPHRDDFEFVIDGRKASATSSRGEQRSMILSLKLVELLLIESLSKIKPILLLDDVFSELDEMRKNYLISSIGSYQTIITSVEDHKDIKSLNKDVQVIKLNEGSVRAGF